MTVRAAASSPPVRATPHPPRASAAAAAAGASKRFTVRDGFHLKSRNAEAKRAIDEQLLPAAATGDSQQQQQQPSVAQESAAADRDVLASGGATSGPSARALALAVQRRLAQREERDELLAETRAGRAIAASNSSSSNNSVEDAEALEPARDVLESTSSQRARSSPGIDTASASGAHLAPPLPLPSSAHTTVEARAIAARLEPSSDWLIYRQRSNVTPRRRDQRVEEMIQRVLETTAAPPTEAVAVSKGTAAAPPLVAVLTPFGKESEVVPPTRPRQPSLSGSTYHQRVLATRQKNSPRTLYPLGELAPLTDTERSLQHSREATNRDVDRLLGTLFQHQQQSVVLAPSAGAPLSVAPGGSTLGRPTPSTLQFSTRRSVFREQTAAALKSRNLVSRMDELRSLPQVLEQMVQQQRAKRQERVARHGEDLVRKNKRQSGTSLLQRPPQTPVFPSAIEQKQQQALRRKQVCDATEDAAVRSAVDRWQLRRQQRQDEARRTYRQCQWLLLAALAQSSERWLGAFHAWKVRRDALRQVVMARRIQAFWRERARLHRHVLAGGGYYRGSSRSPTTLHSPFYRMPRVLNAIAQVQRTMRRWLQRKRDRANAVAVEIIVTSWLEFQDVKFRRLILRFRKRVRDFQVMWRSWRAITDARIKLLLLVWSKLERKSKRRNGVNAKALGLTATSGDAGTALVHALRATQSQVSPEKRQKQLEGMHRHLKNGGTIQAPLSLATTPSGYSAAAASMASPLSASPSKPPSIAAIARALSPGFSTSLRSPKMSGRVKQNLEVRQQITEDFQTAMQDFYATTASGASHHALGASAEPAGATHRLHSPPPLLSPHSPARSGARTSRTRDGAPPSPSSWQTLADAVGPRALDEKVPLQLKVSMLRQLLSEKRKAFQAAKDAKRMEWKARREQMRRLEFRYNVLDELVAYQRFVAEHAVFLVLHHVSESEMLHVMHRAQQVANAAASVAPERPSSSSSGSRAGAHQLLLGPDHAPLALRRPLAAPELDASGPALHSHPSRPVAALARDSRRSTVADPSHSRARASVVSSSIVELLDDTDDELDE